MRPSELLVYIFASFGIGAAIAGGIAFLLIHHYIPSYLSEKGKNLATKEDISGITEKIERVRSQYSVLLEELKAEHQLRLAAVDRRLQAHQEAFSLWRELYGATHTESIGKTVLKCQEWWEHNCLYLEPKVRESFVSAYSAAHSHHAYVQAHADAKLLQENWALVTTFPNILFEAIKLPALTKAESEALKINSNPTGQKHG